jgi:hypothetical protein
MLLVHLVYSSSFTPSNTGIEWYGNWPFMVSMKGFGRRGPWCWYYSSIYLEELTTLIRNLSQDSVDVLGFWHPVVLYTDASVSEKHTVSIFRAKDSMFLWNVPSKLHGTKIQRDTAVSV